MRTCCVKNGLVVVVILLLVGVAVQPVIAVNPISTDNEGDCSICPKVSNLDGITTLKKINKEYVSDLSWDFPIIRGILKIIGILFENISYALFIIVLGWGFAILLIIFGIWILYYFIQYSIQDLLNR